MICVFLLKKRYLSIILGFVSEFFNFFFAKTNRNFVFSSSLINNFKVRRTFTRK